MRIGWVTKRGGGVVAVFFNGWGMDPNVVSHLAALCDVMVVYDYRDLEWDKSFTLELYQEVYIIAWSMGVWAAANIVPLLGIKPAGCIALNGTERPIDNCYGIPPTVYRLTEKGMDEQGREKFFSRMFSEQSGYLRFIAHKSGRELASQCEELVSVREYSTRYRNSLQWNKVYVAEHDIIFPVENQLNWWKDRAPIIKIAGGHYPFYHFDCWEDIFN